eukprot:1195473-Prorocentrum_minimum.AAC.6
MEGLGGDWSRREPLLHSVPPTISKQPWYRDGAALSSIATLSVTAIGAVVLTLPAATATIGYACLPIAVR